MGLWRDRILPRLVDRALATPEVRLHSIHGRLAGGCHLDRPIDRLITDAGFVLTDLNRGYGTGLRLTGYTYRGRAVAS
jgi:hypothetical protein